MENDDLIQVWRDILDAPEKSWVLFENGTCVILMEPEEDLAAQATNLLREVGPVHAGSSFGDFSIITLRNVQGWAVTCHHNDILTFVDPEEVGSNPDDLRVGLLGRSKRGQDAEKLQVIHIEDNRKS